MDNLSAFAVAVLIIGIFMWNYLRKEKKKAEQARAAAEKGKLFSEGPLSQHPHIDANYCIGCAGCTMVCPEGDVLAMLGGKAVIVNGYKCIGHSLCAEVCPVGAITMVMANASMGADMPHLTPEYETTVKNMFIVGELGGLALIKNAVNQGRECIDTIVKRKTSLGGARSAPGLFDVLIVGAGPAGISASLRATENKLNYITLDAGEIGGTVAKYPRQKLVMTSPVQFPMHGKFNKTELSKEDLLAFWKKVLARADFNCRQGEKVEDIKKEQDGIFTVTSPKSQYRARNVVLALGKGGNPRKLGVPGEELPKVMYRLIEADHYVNKKILVVGGGDSAIEAAMGLGYQVGNQVTLSYRKEAFSRIKERNAQRVEESIRKGKVKVIFNSNPVEFKKDSIILEVNGKQEEIPNDFVWIFAGGEPPTAFLKKVGVGFGEHDLTSTGSKEAREAIEAKRGGVVENSSKDRQKPLSLASEPLEEVTLSPKQTGVSDMRNPVTQPKAQVTVAKSSEINGTLKAANAPMVPQRQPKRPKEELQLNHGDSMQVPKPAVNRPVNNRPTGEPNRTTGLGTLNQRVNVNQASSSLPPDRPKNGNGSDQAGSLRGTEGVNVPVYTVVRQSPTQTVEGRTLRVEGEVVLDTVFLASGQVQVTQVVSGLGHGLDAAAIQEAKQIRFTPAKQDGRPVDFPARVRIEFRMTS